jgi:HlyD family secretion protein
VVEKIEPRATVQQSVTFFPVLVRLDNDDRALMPGMNSDVSILVDQRDAVLAVPIDAVRTTRDAAQAATALGVDPQRVRDAVQTARGGRGAGAGGDAAPSNTVAVGGDRATAGGAATGAGAARAGRRGRARPGRGGAGGGGAGGAGGASQGGPGAGGRAGNSLVPAGAPWCSSGRTRATCRASSRSG